MNMIVCFGGTVTYAYNFLQDMTLIWISTCTTLAMLILIVSSEIVYRRWRRPQPHFAFDKSPSFHRAISSTEFDIMVARGQKLVILNEMILDLKDYS